MIWFGLMLLMRVMCRSIAESSRRPGESVREGVRCRWRRVGGECEWRGSSIARGAVDVS